jgi:putative membrane protein
MILWLKAIHIISFVAWFAGLFYMFRIFVYHSENKQSSEVTCLLKIMARRLYLYITMPAMIATMTFGIAMLVVQPSYLSFAWLQMKLVCVSGLLAYHFYIGYVRRRFLHDDVYLNSKQCRLRNEIPTIFLIAIVLLDVLRP